MLKVRLREWHWHMDRHWHHSMTLLRLHHLLHRMRHHERVRVRCNHHAASIGSELGRRIEHDDSAAVAIAMVA